MFWDYGGDNDSELISVIIDNIKEKNMTKKERYKELIKENNNVLNALSDDYRKVGYNYVKKLEVTR